MIFYIFIPSVLGWLFFRFIGLCLGDPVQARYAKIFALAALLWGPLQLGWYSSLAKNHSYWVKDTSKPPIGRYANGMPIHPSKFIEVPRYHYGIGYKFNLGNPIAKFIYDKLSWLGTMVVMSFVDVLILGSICSFLVWHLQRPNPHIR
jgi:hypothetical protein